jgi:hypothetical protein
MDQSGGATTGEIYWRFFGFGEGDEVGGAAATGPTGPADGVRARPPPSPSADGDGIGQIKERPAVPSVDCLVFGGEGKWFFISEKNMLCDARTSGGQGS